MAEKKNATEESRKIKNIKSIIAVCVCIIIAFGMWVYVMTVESPEHEQVFDGVTVELTGVDALAENELAIFSGYGMKVDVILAGKKSVVSKLSTEDVIVTADLSSVKASGRYSIKTTVDVPAGCKLVEVSQDTVPVYVDRSSQIAVDLSEVRENTFLPEGCFTGAVDLDVDKVTVTGPLSILSKVGGAVVTLDMSDITKTTTVTEEIVLVDADGSRIDSPYIDFYPKTITATVPILKTVRIPIEVEFKNGFLNYDNTDILLDPEFVEVTGDAELVNKGDCIAPVVVDEKTSLFGGRYSSVVTLEAAEGLELSTQKAKLSVQLKPFYSIREFTVREENISSVGSTEGVEFTWRYVPVNVEILGRTDVLSKIKDEDLTIVFDMSPYSVTNSGTVRIKADVVVPHEYENEILLVGTYFVDVTFGKADE